MNTLKEALDSRGITPNQASKLGLNYSTVLKTYKGLRSVTPAYAIRYELILGIPRSELRPDMWPPATPNTPSEPEEVNHGLA